MCELDLDVVSECFSEKESPTYSKECKDFVKQNMFIIFDKVTWNNETGENRLVVYVYDGDYLTSGLRKELARTSNRFDTTWYVVNNLRDMTDKRNALSDHCQFCDLSIIRDSRSFSMINALHDPNRKFNYVSMVGVVMNRQIQED